MEPRTISEVDAKLEAYREVWLHAENDKDKAYWLEKINQMLDKRLELMEARQWTA